MHVWIFEWHTFRAKHIEFYARLILSSFSLTIKPRRSSHRTTMPMISAPLSTSTSQTSGTEHTSPSANPVPMPMH